MFEDKELSRVFGVVDVGIGKVTERLQQLNELLVWQRHRGGEDHIDDGRVEGRLVGNGALLHLEHKLQDEVEMNPQGVDGLCGQPEKDVVSFNNALLRQFAQIPKEPLGFGCHVVTAVQNHCLLQSLNILSVHETHVDVLPDAVQQGYALHMEVSWLFACIICIQVGFFKQVL